MVGLTGRTVAVVALAAVLVTGSGVASAATSHGGLSGCSTHGLAVGRGASATYVEGLSARGLSCRRARAIASRVVEDLARGEAISIADASGLTTSQVSSCSDRCVSKTQVVITYPHGSVEMSLGGAVAVSGGGVPNPTFGGSPGYLTA